MFGSCESKATIRREMRRSKEFSPKAKRQTSSTHCIRRSLLFDREGALISSAECHQLPISHPITLQRFISISTVRGTRNKQYRCTCLGPEKKKKLKKQGTERKITSWWCPSHCCCCFSIFRKKNSKRDIRDSCFRPFFSGSSESLLAFETNFYFAFRVIY